MFTADIMPTIFILLACYGLSGMYAAGLLFPRLGRFLYGTEWPGHIPEPRHKKAVYYKFSALSISFFLLGSSSIIPTVTAMGLLARTVFWILISLGLICSGIALWLHFTMRQK